MPKHFGYAFFAHVEDNLENHDDEIREQRVQEKIFRYVQNGRKILYLADAKVALLAG